MFMLRFTKGIMPAIKAHTVPDEDPVLPDDKPKPENIPEPWHEPPVRDPSPEEVPPVKDPPAHPQATT
jgi:hypothetical protein